MLLHQTSLSCAPSLNDESDADVLPSPGFQYRGCGRALSTIASLVMRERCMLFALLRSLFSVISTPVKTGGEILEQDSKWRDVSDFSAAASK